MMSPIQSHGGSCRPLEDADYTAQQGQGGGIQDSQDPGGGGHRGQGGGGTDEGLFSVPSYFYNL